MKFTKSKAIMMPLTAVLLTGMFMTGCTRLTEVKETPQETVVTTVETTQAPTESTANGVYVKLERDDVSSISLQVDSFTKACQNANGSTLKADEWIFTGDDIAQLSMAENSSVLFTVRAWNADNALLGEGTFLYDAVQEKLYVTISADGVTCATAPDAPANVPPVLTLPILDEIDEGVTIGVSGSSLSAVQAAAKLLDWGVNTGLDVDEISEAASTWLAAKISDLPEFLQKLEMVDDAYQKLLTGDTRELLDSAGCADVAITWGSEPVAPVEAIMQTAGLRYADNTQEPAIDNTQPAAPTQSVPDDSWKAAFEQSLLENYGVTPDHYEDLGGGIYQVYVKINGQVVPYVAVDSATGDYHG